MSAVRPEGLARQRALDGARFLFNYEALDSAYTYRNGVTSVALLMRRPLWEWSIAVARSEILPGSYEMNSTVRLTSKGPTDLATAAYTLRQVLAGGAARVANDHHDRAALARDSFLAAGAWYLFIGSRLVLQLDP